MEENDIKAKGVHGTNERISIRAYLQGIRVLIRFMEQTC
jgi:carboxypeptidase PM20D1